MSMGSGTHSRGCLFVTGCLVLSLMLFVCKNCIVCRRMRSSLGSLPFLLFRLLGQISLVVSLFFLGRYSLVDVVRDSFGRFVRARLLHADSTFDVVLLYAPNLWSGRVLFFPSLLPLLDPSVPTLLCGDFNSVMDPGRDCRNAGGQSLTDTPDILVSLFRDLSCVDVWRSCHPTQQAFTWLRPDGTRASRIDLVGCPVSWLSSVSSCDIFACPISDHSAVSLSLDSLPGVVPRGPGFWKLNTSILSECDYISEISSFWSAWQNSRLFFVSLRLVGPG